MFLRSTTPVRAGRMERRNKAVRAAKIGAILLVPLIMAAFPSNPPAGESGAAVSGGSTCGTNSCHFHGTTAATGGVTVTFPSGLTYTPGGPAETLMVNAASGSGGFELSATTSSGAQAGSFTAGTNSTVSTLNGVQYILQTNTATSWSFTWTPPATNVGNVVMNVAGVSGGSLFANVYTLTPASPPPTNTLSATPATLTFTSTGGAVPPTQNVSVTSSGASIAFTTSTSTTSGGAWLTATPPGANTPMSVTVSVNPAGLAAGTYTGSVTVASTAATNSPRTVGVTFTVVAAPPPTPNLTLTPTSMTFNSTGGGAVTPQNVQVTSTGTALTFTTMASTTSGGNWLSISAPTGTTPVTLSVMVNATGLAAGTYMGSVRFTSSGAGNSPQTLGVTLTVAPQTPPGSAPPLTFSFHVLDKESSGTQRMILSGNGSIDAKGSLTGSGNFTIFTSGKEDTPNNTIATGKWTADSVTSFTPVSGSGGGGGGGGEDAVSRNASRHHGGSGSNGGVLVITVNLSPMGGTPMMGSMTIADTGSRSGVSLSIDGGASFVPTGTGSVSIQLTGTSGGGGGGDELVSHQPGEGN